MGIGTGFRQPVGGIVDLVVRCAVAVVLAGGIVLVGLLGAVDLRRCRLVSERDGAGGVSARASDAMTANGETKARTLIARDIGGSVSDNGGNSDRAESAVGDVIAWRRMASTGSWHADAQRSQTYPRFSPWFRNAGRRAHAPQRCHLSAAWTRRTRIPRSPSATPALAAFLDRR